VLKLPVLMEASVLKNSIKELDEKLLLKN